MFQFLKPHNLVKTIPVLIPTLIQKRFQIFFPIQDWFRNVDIFGSCFERNKMITKQGTILRHIQENLWLLSLKWLKYTNDILINQLTLHNEKFPFNQTDLTPILTKIVSKLKAWPVLTHLSKQLPNMYTFLNQSWIGKNIWNKDDRINHL